MTNRQLEYQIRTLSAIADRLRLQAGLGTSHGGARDYYQVFGYKRKLSFEDYYSRYDRQDIAGRIVDAPARTTWRKPPLVYETEDSATETPFEKAWNELLKRHRIWHYMQRVDRLAGIGRFAILLLGFRGDDDLAKPVSPGQFKGVDDLLYLAAYHEGSVEINDWVTNPSDPRFGLPNTYKLKLGSTDGKTGIPRRTVIVHHSRVIHVAEELDEDEVFGRPRLHRVFNLLDDLQKLVGASAEMFWQGAYRGPAVTTREGYQLDETAAEKLAEEIDEYIHGLRRFMRLHGLEVQFPQGQSPDPSKIFDVVMTLIAAVTGIPKRILMGSERGELASTKDEDNWLGRIVERQQQFAEPVILRPFIDRLIEVGILPTPMNGYTVEWPPLFVLSEKDQAEINRIRAETARVLAPDGRVDLLIPRQEARVVFLGLDEEPNGGLPENRFRQLEEWQAESQLGIISRREMLRKRGLSEAEIDRILQEVEDDRGVEGFGIGRLAGLLAEATGGADQTDEGQGQGEEQSAQAEQGAVAE